MILITTFLACISSILMASLLRYLSPAKGTSNPPILGSENRFHSCKYCNHIVVPWPEDPVDENGFNYRVPVTLQQAHRAAAAGCDFFQILGSNMITRDVRLGHLSGAYWQMFYDVILDRYGWAANLAGLNSFSKRFQYFLAALGPYPYVLRFARYRPEGRNGEPPGGIYCRPMFLSNSHFELDVSAEEGM